MAEWKRGLAALALASGLAAGGIALARGPDMNLTGFGGGMGGSNFFASPEPSPPRARAASVRPSEDGDEGERRTARPRRSRGGGGAAFGYGTPVCVKLCDGSFFPTASISGGDAACAAQCPDAPTALYTMPTERIEDAVSSTGAAYTKLPVAKRFQSTFDNTCTCHRDSVASVAKELLHDSTLRKGDVVMTPSGFRVYEGEGYVPSSPKDFVALSKAAGVPKESRATLAAMEQARVGGSPPPSAPPSVAAARSKGNVTVDDGDAPPAQ